MELVDMQDLKSCSFLWSVGSIPIRGTKRWKSIHRQIDSQVLFELLDSAIVNNRNSIKYTINKPPTTIALPVGGFFIW